MHLSRLPLLLAALALASAAHAGDSPKNFTAAQADQWPGPIYHLTAANNYVIAEAENLGLSNKWQKRTDAGNATSDNASFINDPDPNNYRGTGYMRWIGGNQGNGVTEADTAQAYQGNKADWLVVKVWVETAGSYTIDVRNHHRELDGDNDVWVSVLGYQGTIPRMADRVRNGYTWVDWNNARSFSLQAGLNGILLVGRSNNFGIDRVAIFRGTAAATARNPNTPESPLYQTDAPQARITATPTTGDAPLTVTFSATQSTDNGTLTAYSWNFGDGTTATGATTTHTYPNLGTYTATLTITDNDNNQATATQTIVVAGQDPHTPVTLPARLQAENFDLGGQGIAFHDTDTTNQGGKYRTDTGVDIETCTDTGGGFSIGYTQVGEWLEYTVQIPAPGTYQLTLRTATTRSSGSVHLAHAGQNLTGPIAIPNTGGWQTWTTVNAGTLTLPAGKQVLRLNFDTADINLNWLDLALVTPPTPTFATWLAANHPTLTGANALPTADPDADGFPNLLEYALGSNPNAAASQPDLKSQITDLKLQLEFTPKALTGLTYTIQASSDLSSWTDTDITDLTLDAPYTFIDSVTISPTNPKRFLRLRVSE